MRHDRKEVIQRAIQEYELLDALLVSLSPEEWLLPLLRPEDKDPWTVKDAVAHITHWKADAARSARGERRLPEERGLVEKDANRRIYLLWHDRSIQDVIAWHRQVQQQVLAALREAPEKWFTMEGSAAKNGLMTW